MAERSISLSRDILATAGRVFAILARAAVHPEADGSGTLRTATEDVVISIVGEVFAMIVFQPGEVRDPRRRVLSDQAG